MSSLIPLFKPFHSLTDSLLRTSTIIWLNKIQFLSIQAMRKRKRKMKIRLKRKKKKFSRKRRKKLIQIRMRKRKMRYKINWMMIMMTQEMM
jgi:hypothetical protein